MFVKSSERSIEGILKNNHMRKHSFDQLGLYQNFNQSSRYGNPMIERDRELEERLALEQKIFKEKNAHIPVHTGNNMNEGLEVKSMRKNHSLSRVGNTPYTPSTRLERSVRFADDSMDLLNSSSFIANQQRSGLSPHDISGHYERAVNRMERSSHALTDSLSYSQTLQGGNIPSDFGNSQKVRSCNEGQKIVVVCDKKKKKKSGLNEELLKMKEKQIELENSLRESTRVKKVVQPVVTPPVEDISQKVNVMADFIGEIEEKKSNEKEEGILKEICRIRKKWEKEKKKIHKFYETTLSGMRDSLALINQKKKEYEVSLKISEPKKIDLERRLKMIEASLRSSAEETTRIGKSEAFLKASLDSIRAQIKQREDDVAVLELRIKEDSREKKHLFEESSRLRRETAELEGSLNAAEGENNRLRNELDLKTKNLSDQIKVLRAKSHELESELESIRKKRDKRQEKSEKLKKKKALLKTEHLSILENIKGLDASITELNNDIIRLRQIKSTPNVIEKLVDVPVEVETPIIVENKVGQEEVHDLIGKTTAMEHDAQYLKRNIGEITVVLQEKAKVLEIWRKKCSDLEISIRQKALTHQGNYTNMIRDLEKKITETEEKNRFLEGELDRVTKINREKNIEAARYIEVLSEKNRELENSLKYPMIIPPF